MRHVVKRFADLTGGNRAKLEEIWSFLLSIPSPFGVVSSLLQTFKKTDGHRQ